MAGLEQWEVAQLVAEEAEEERREVVEVVDTGVEILVGEVLAEEVEVIEECHLQDVVLIRRQDEVQTHHHREEVAEEVEGEEDVIRRGRGLHHVDVTINSSLPCSTALLKFAHQNVEQHFT